MALSLCGELKESFVVPVLPSSHPQNLAIPIKLFAKRSSQRQGSKCLQKKEERLIADKSERISSILTESPPLTSHNFHRQYASRSCTIWIHLQASISTEWEQKSIVINPKTTKIGSKTVSQGPFSIQERLASPSRMHVSPIQIGGSTHSEGHQGVEINSFNPKTVHRCILQTFDKPKYSQSFDLECHVCSWKYSSYDKYFNHLIELHCARQKVVLSNLKKQCQEIPFKEKCQKRKHRLYQPSQETQLEKSNPCRGVHECSLEIEQKEKYLQREIETKKEDIEEEEEVEDVPLNLTSKKSKLLLLKEGSQDPVLTSSIVGNEIFRYNKESVKKLTNDLQKTIVFYPETIDDSVYCPHWASKYLPALSVSDNVNDEITLSELRAQITKLLLLVFGEEKLTVELGYPVKDVFEILETASSVYGRIKNVYSEIDACQVECQRQTKEHSTSTSYFVTQLRYRLLKRKINSTKKNILKFIESLPYFYDLS